MKGKLLIITGASAGAGKDTMLKMLLEHDPSWHQPVSTTTRDPRPGETHGKEMSFVSRAQFEQWQKEGKFLESDYHADNWYGTLAEPVKKLLATGEKVVLRIDVNGALMVEEQLPEAISIFMTVENMEELERRIRSRASEDEAGIKSRLELAARENKLGPKFDHTIINPAGRPEIAFQELLKIVEQ